MVDQSADHAAPASIENFERFLASMVPPNTLGGAARIFPEVWGRFERQDLWKLVPALAGLATEPQFQANLVRLDWATRFALVSSRGRKSLRSREVSEMLNGTLDQVRVNLLEDPIESTVIERISTRCGDRLLITGLWENAGFHTECLLRAFEALPDHPIKSGALKRAYALLALANEIALRTDFPVNQAGGGAAKGAVNVPNEARLRALGRRVHFSFKDLASLGIDPGDLTSFILSEEATQHLVGAVAGNSPLEFMPILQVENGILVASVSNLTTALRADLISTALDNNMSVALRTAILIVHGEMLNVAGFLGRFPARLVDDGGVLRREAVWEQPNGFWVHVVQLVDELDGWPHAAFGSVAKFDPSATQTLSNTIAQTRTHCLAQPGFVEGITICLVGGVGRGFVIDKRLELDAENWTSLTLCPSDVVTMGLVEGGKFNDVWRLAKIEALTREMGFNVHSASGWLNLFQWWKCNKLKLVPEHMIDLEPPAMVSFDTNLLLETRQEAVGAADFRILNHPTLGARRVTRKSRSPQDDGYELIYVDLEAAEQFVPRVAVKVDEVIWWVELEYANDNDLPEVLIRTWDGLVHWAAKCLSYLGSKFDLSPGSMCIKLKIAPMPEDDITSPPNADLDELVSLQVDDESGECHIRVAKDWHKFLCRADNIAELFVASRMIEGFWHFLRGADNGSDFIQLALEAVGSPHYRWRHVAEVITPIEQLKQLGLAGQFREIRPSAGALVQFGTCWEIRERCEGPRIEGYESSVDFVHRYQTHLLGKLIARVRGYDRKALIGYSLCALQAAEGELSHWAVTANAMRAIHGELGDHHRSMELRSKAYGVIRASSIITEIGLCEAGKDGSRQPGAIDFDELQALALMVFETADVLAAIRLHRVEPRIHISPTGEMLTNHDFEEESIQASGLKLNLKNRRSDAQRYVTRFEESDTSHPKLEFQDAILAEFGTPWEGVMDLGIVTAHLAAKRSSGVFDIKRSELLSEMRKFEPLAKIDLGPALDRITMRSRPSWTDLPEGWFANDIDLGRLGRRHSLISKPIIALDSKEDPDLLVCPAAVFRSVLYMFQGAMDGSLQNDYWQSLRMRQYASTAGRLAGNRFNDTVTETIQSYGFEAQAGVSPSGCLNIKATDEVKRLGDVDSLALDRATNTVWVIEAKDLRLCRTLGEAARRLSAYQGKYDERGRPDKLRRHLDRVEFIRARAAMLCPRLGLGAPPIVRGLVVIRAPQPLEGACVKNGEDAHVVMLDELVEFLRA
ncbi:hypothetical protein [Maricaulis sp.]|uniref:hypothetical protein n=1 Tax=Maricaulis sp. TaxID=1486257 RepID=UPI003A8EF0DA